MFQEGRLFPHLTVRHNLLYGRWFDTTKIMWRASIRRLNCSASATCSNAVPARFPAARSSAWRSAARCWRIREVLLLDEPLASLDAPRKAEILYYIERLRDEVRIPIVYVSHSLDEVVRLADYRGAAV